jgi:hypothetical protein
MRLKRLSSWLVPTFGGCVGATWIAVTLLAIFGPTEPLLGGRFMNWVVGMLIATPLALLLVGALIAVDVLLLRWRRIPVGRRAWVSSSIAPILVGVVYTVHRPAQYGETVAFVLAIVLPIAAVAFAVRMIFGRQPSG